MQSKQIQINLSHYCDKPIELSSLSVCESGNSNEMTQYVTCKNCGTKLAKIITYNQ